MAVVFQTFSYADAQVRVHVTTDRGRADLWVHVVEQRGLSSGDAAWYMTANRAEASSRIYLCSRAVADLTVCFVSSRAQAGWQCRQNLRRPL